MPLYRWQRKSNGFTVEVLRSFKDYETPPLPEELPEDQRDATSEDWDRLIAPTGPVIKWPNSTGPVKGRA